MITKDHIEAFIELTERHNKQALTTCLIENIREIASVATVSVYELYSHDRHVEFNADNLASALLRDPRDSSWTGDLLTTHEDLVQCVSSQAIIRLKREAPFCMRIIFPVKGKRDVIGLLVIDCKVCGSETLYLIEAMSQVWNSQLFHLDRNERDGLTGLFNRQALDSRMPNIFGELLNKPKRQQDKTISKSLAMLDIDHFKEVNDKFGHLYGDELLVHFAQIMTKSFRYYDYLFRYGGEEFVVILNNVDSDMAISILDRFRKAVEDYHFPQVGTKTVSIGVIQITPGELPSTILDKADKALYYAKQHGRNQVCVYEQLIAEGQLQTSEIPTGDIELF